MLERAEAWQAMLREPGVGSRAGLAAHLGLSRARVSQALAVLTVPTLLKNALSQAAARGRPVGEGEWRRLRGLPVSEALRRLQEQGYLPEE